MNPSTINNVVLLIPSLNPDEHLPIYAKELLDAGFTKLIIVNDGSTEETAPIFDDLAKKEGITVLHHEINQGKGRALKTAFQYILEHYSSEEIAGVVTADADGQHGVADTIKVAQTLADTSAFVLGSRNFSQDNVPPKSRFGNNFTTGLFALLYGKKIMDTQTGLRGIPYDFLDTCCKLKGERFEYEIVMLIEAVHSGRNVIENEIETIYINSNRATHFRAVKDSAKIIGIMLKCFLAYILTSLLSSLIDIGCFALFTKVVFSGMAVETCIGLGTLFARVISSLFNYSMNRKAVFRDTSAAAKSLVRYYILCVAQMLCSYGLVVLVHTLLPWDTTLLKAIIDTILFLISYQIQRHWVFKK